jgi:hypothetical protein
MMQVPVISLRPVAARAAFAPLMLLALLLGACNDGPTAVASNGLPTLSKGSGSSLAPAPAPTGAPTVSSLSVSPNVIVGGTTGQATVTLSAAPATCCAVVLVWSDNSFVLSAPDSVVIAPPARSATFTVTTIPVTGTFTLNLSAGINSTIQSARVYVTPTAETDLLTIPRLDLSPKSTSPPLGEVKIEATSTNPSAVLTAEYAGTPVATLRNNGGGKYSATFTIPTLDTDIVVRSNFGGCAVKATNRPTPSRSCPSL